MSPCSDFRLSDYEASARLGQELMEQIHERNNSQKGTSTHAKVCAKDTY